MMFLHFAASAARTESHTYEWRGRETAASGLESGHPSARSTVKTLLPSMAAALVRLCRRASENHRFLSSRRELVVGLAPPPPLAPPHQLTPPPLCALASAHHKDESFQSPSAFTPPSKTCWPHDSVYCTYSRTCRLI